jgi:Fe-S cluster assembly scaffold protein SufB
MICAKRLRQNVPSSTEAAIGSVDKKQMETLMAHGLSPEEAVDVIVKGILR